VRLNLQESHMLAHFLNSSLDKGMVHQSFSSGSLKLSKLRPYIDNRKIDLCSDYMGTKQS